MGGLWSNEVELGIQKGLRFMISYEFVNSQRRVEEDTSAFSHTERA